ncbi:hypothetical protein CONLIGDRAFT_165305 [Coniochaeta ligniaria NRRL 30616]|uniref:Uncharacterized protein n=1 Tax=Coniochaeta ligniaria NRRL 30616 TaxID=1408157 RepID=A0A1J7JZG3_9PEZI|nr:hypothetical protein CONLIGDRAFT_165305 [Coniochaeta ligniaria NRRL 30616]
MCNVSQALSTSTGPVAACTPKTGVSWDPNRCARKSRESTIVEISIVCRKAVQLADGVHEPATLVRHAQALSRNIRMSAGHDKTLTSRQWPISRQRTHLSTLSTCDRRLHADDKLDGMPVPTRKRWIGSGVWTESYARLTAESCHVLPWTYRSAAAWWRLDSSRRLFSSVRWRRKKVYPSSVHLDGGGRRLQRAYKDDGVMRQRRLLGLIRQL